MSRVLQVDFYGPRQRLCVDLSGLDAREAAVLACPESGAGAMSEQLALEMEGERAANLRAAAMERDWPPEEWKLAVDFPDYAVSDWGNVKRLTRAPGARAGAILKWCIASHGYLSVSLRKDGQTYTRLVHQLVLEAFVGPCPDGLECLHEDDDKRNPRLRNLRWGTRKENAEEMVERGRSTRGVRAGNVRLNEFTVRMLRHLRGLGHSCKDLARIFSIPYRTAVSAIDGYTWGWLDEGGPPSAEWIAAHSRRL